ncbi:DUF805 domain-containing protein [Synechococcus sp. LTW-R]|uniref:DUF805 domain-containing protein n=1 Tax=Synechococcus sp. LTW-R TaxID=2751170 RepID=UPI0016237D29|nr:DUF805 domain-containing protein [Synechococcus sp. LTW-R]
MIRYYFEGWRKSFDFKGRSGRNQFWWFVFWDCLILLILLLSVSAFDHLSLSSLKAEGANPNLALFTDVASLMEKSSSFLFVILLLLTMLPRIALAVRRLRDTARSTVWLLLVFVPFGSLVLWIWFMGPTRDVNYAGMSSYK